MFPMIFSNICSLQVNRNFLKSVTTAATSGAALGAVPLDSMAKRIYVSDKRYLYASIIAHGGSSVVSRFLAFPFEKRKTTEQLGYGAGKGGKLTCLWPYGKKIFIESILRLKILQCYVRGGAGVTVPRVVYPAALVALSLPLEMQYLSKVLGLPRKGLGSLAFYNPRSPHINLLPLLLTYSVLCTLPLVIASARGNLRGILHGAVLNALTSTVLHPLDTIRRRAMARAMVAAAAREDLEGNRSPSLWSGLSFHFPKMLVEIGTFSMCYPLIKRYVF